MNGLLVGVLLAALALLVAMRVVGGAAQLPSGGLHHGSQPVVVPPDAVPEVEPIEFRALPAEEARAVNAQVPFSTAPNPPARPFRFIGGTEDRLRALDCLSAAVLYEAGDDPAGQRAVAQVVLNRVRHPAFPRSVCGVVFQGAERRTGCQFTFTCDGALLRAVPQAFWDRARKIAEAALSGAVDKRVGHATHYHTDWVVPYWSASLDKIAAVHTHLFFRWSGWWGTPAAFRFTATGIEPRIAQLAGRFAEHGLGIDGAAPGEEALGPVPVTIGNASPKPSADDPDAFLVPLSPSNAANFAEIAAFTCGARPRCKFMGWTDPRKVPTGASGKLSSEQLASLSFSYLRDRSLNLERALWNCAETKRPAGQCMWSKAPPPAVGGTGKPVQPAPLPAAAAIPQLDGVRFKTPPKAEPKP